MTSLWARPSTRSPNAKRRAGSLNTWLPIWWSCTRLIKSLIKAAALHQCLRSRFFKRLCRGDYQSLSKLLFLIQRGLHAFGRVCSCVLWTRRTPCCQVAAATYEQSRKTERPLHDRPRASRSCTNARGADGDAVGASVPVCTALHANNARIDVSELTERDSAPREMRRFVGRQVA